MFVLFASYYMHVISTNLHFGKTVQKNELIFYFYICSTMLTRGVTITFVLLACLQIALCHDPTTQPTPTWRKNCFSETESSNDCSANTIKILSHYYTCDLAIEMDNIPEEIAYLHGTILVAVGDETFFVRNEQLEPVVGKISVPPSWNDFTDNNDNRFYVTDSGTLVTENQARSDIEILTTGEFTKQIVLDTDQKKLLILSYNPGDSAGSLFALNTDSLNSTEGVELEATKIEKAGEDISTFAVESGTAKLLLGLRTEAGGGKIIRLSRQEGYPCTETDAGKRAIMHIIEETKDKISKTLEDILTEKPSSKIDRTSSQVNEMELERKNKDLTKQVLILKSRLEAYQTPPAQMLPSRYPSEYPSQYPSQYPSYIQSHRQSGYPRTDPGPITQQQEDLSNIIPYIVDRGRSVFQCVTMNDFENLKTKFVEKENAIMELRQQLYVQANTQCNPHYVISPPYIQPPPPPPLY